MKIKIPIELITLEDASYHIMVEAVFNKTIRGNLIIDTGASKSVLDFSFAESFAHSIEEVQDQNSSGINALIHQAHVGTIDKFQLGKLKIKDYQTVLLDLSHINQLYANYSDKTIAGLLGSDFLVEYNAVIDYGKKKLFLQID
ncbi:MAG: retropepsin-like aspartic protease [Salinivirgaceae bacterium]|jgi:hypothetical protein